ncbi:MAG: DNA alkylation repair protein [Salinivirgaceae bacterium]|nr:DNA alkylation repair protein [Salinivirgaceae bacterium]
MFGLPTHLQNTDDVELKQIMQQAVMLQNGMVASTMAKAGVHGVMNYGVSQTDLRGLARQYGINHSLARRLCPLQIREAKILASLLFDANSLIDSDLQMIFDSVINLDLAENLAHNIIWKIDDTVFYSRLIEADKWHIVAAVYAVGQGVARHGSNSDNLTAWFVENLETIVNKNLAETLQPVVSTMGTIAGSSAQRLKTITDIAQKLQHSPSAFAQNVGNQVVMLNEDF